MTAALHQPTDPDPSRPSDAARACRLRIGTCLCALWLSGLALLGAVDPAGAGLLLLAGTGLRLFGGRAATGDGLANALLAAPPVPAPLAPRDLPLPATASLKPTPFAASARGPRPAGPLAFPGLSAPGPGHADDGAQYAGRSVLVTGAGGSIGRALCLRLAAACPSRLVLVDQCEAALYAIDKDLRHAGTGVDIVPILGSAGDACLMRGALVRHRVEIVFHSAAYKHVPLVEQNPVKGIENNALATRCLGDAAIAAGVDRFILVSTDKAVRPKSVMGATKRLAELFIQDLGRRATGTGFSIVRFGNVLGSSGSVVPLFQEQIARGGPVTLTHEAVTRYFMTMEEAAHLLLVAGSFRDDSSGRTDVFVLDMGPPLLVRDLAREMIRAAGRTVRDRQHPHGDIEIRTIGLRPGEKLHEELLIGTRVRPTAHPGILRAEDAAPAAFDAAQAVRLLRQAVAANDANQARRLAFRWVERDPTDREAEPSLTELVAG